jgi:UDP-N-acetylglucosamine 2-epimerase (non-hydrolysing)
MSREKAYPVDLHSGRFFHDAISEDDAPNHVTQQLGAVEFSPVTFRHFKKILRDLIIQEYFLVSCHREENVDDAMMFRRLLDVLRNLVDAYGKRVIVSTHPRTRRRIENESDSLPPGVDNLKPFGFSDYVKLQKHAEAVLSDRGRITEESNILGFPALNIREVHERPEGMEEGAVMMVGMDWARNREGLAVLETQSKVGNRSLRIVGDYAVPNVSDKVVRIILSYTDYVNRTVWRKSII